jgi:hypothetical protein
MRWFMVVALLGLFVAPLVQGQELADVPPPPEIPDEAYDPEMLEGAPPPVLDERARQQQLLEEADITLIERPDAMIREYRVGGRLFMVEVIPRVGRPYYLIDSTGDGQMDTRRNRLGPNFVPPQWILFQW